jgi:glycosyltransferase involved in cell wall biosynthesis
MAPDLRGGLDRDEAWASSVRAEVAALGIASRIAFAGELEREPLDVRYDAADVFVLPTWYEATAWRWPKRSRAGCRS